MIGRVTYLPMMVGEEELLVEVRSFEGGSENTSRTLDSARDAIVNGYQRVQSAIIAIGESTRSTINQLANSAAKPEELQIKFGLKFSAQGNVIIAGAAAEANLEVTLKYRSTTVL